MRDACYFASTLACSAARIPLYRTAGRIRGTGEDPNLSLLKDKKRIFSSSTIDCFPRRVLSVPHPKIV